MSSQPTVSFLSLFVPDLAKARARYQAVLGVEPVENDDCALRPHPFAAAGPVVFDLGSIKLALYQADQKGTHPGDVGIGLEVAEGPAQMAQRAASHGGRVFFGPTAVPGDGRQLAVFVLPDRHFFEVVEPRPSSGAPAGLSRRATA